MRRRASHATHRPFDASLHRSVRRLLDRIAPRLRLGLLASGRNLLSIGIGLVILALIGLLVANFVGQVMQSARLEAGYATLADEVAELGAQNVELEAAVSYAESDVNVERIAREQLGYARAGETVLLPQIPTAPAAAAPAPTPIASPSPAPATPNWQLWWQAFFPTQP
jgi:cell division protein FtsB